MFKVYHGISDRTPVTKPITDEKMAHLALNVLYSMGESDCVMTVDGRREKLLSDGLYVIDDDGNTIDRHMDREWYLGCDEVAKEAQINLLMEEDGFDRKTAEDAAEKYTALTYDEDGDRLRFLPETWDYDKAVNMAAIMQFGIADNIEFYTAKNEKINIAETSIANEDGEYLGDPKMPEWIEDGPSFADAVESLSDDASAMEQ